jgi:hypothetical protein
MRVSFSSSQGRGRSFEDVRYEFLRRATLLRSALTKRQAGSPAASPPRSRNVSWRTCSQFAREIATAIRSRPCQ